MKQILTKIASKTWLYWLKNAFNYAVLFVFFVNSASAAIIPSGTEALSLDGLESVINQTSIANRTSGIINSKTLTVSITAYSSTVDQTDETPFITASGAPVADNVIAANFLPFGTRVKIPKIFGDKIFVIKDRMHNRFNDRIDIWFADRESALKFGIQESEIIIL